MKCLLFKEEIQDGGFFAPALAAVAVMKTQTKVFRKLKTMLTLANVMIRQQHTNSPEIPANDVLSD